MRKLVIVCGAIFLAATCQAGTIYVDADANGLNDGTSWVNAYNYLQDALTEAGSNPDINKIWVAEGTYKPDKGGGKTEGDRTAAFQLINGMKIYGGFPSGGGTWEERDPNAYETILSGDLNGDDAEVLDPCDLLNESTRAENSYHVLTGGGTNATAELNGFTITGGNANSIDPYSSDRYGSGMYNNNGSPTVSNCRFRSNSAYYDGGGMYNGYNSSPVVSYCMFIGNSAMGSGGMCNEVDSGPMVSNCTFSSNFAIIAGGIYSYESCLTVTNCTFTGNEGGGIENVNSSPTITNCMFSGNSAGLGGGMRNLDNSNTTISNCTFNGNSADLGGGMCNMGYSAQGDFIVSNCTFSDNSAYEGGGVYNESFESGCTYTGCIFSSNSALSGGGMFNLISNPNVIDCAFSGNIATDTDGGGMCNLGGSPKVSNCTLSSNSATKYGGGIASAGNSSLAISDCTFSGNYAGLYGGGINNINNNSTTIIGCTFNGNSAAIYGGGMLNENGNMTLTNSIFCSNIAREGGGMYIGYYNITVTNCTFNGNMATDYVGGINNHVSSSATVTNSIFWGNSDKGGMNESAQIQGSTIIIDYSCVQGWTGSLGGVGNIGADPCFVSGPVGDYYLSQIAAGQATDSPCVDAGSDTAANLGVDIFTTRTDLYPDEGMADMGYHYPRVRFADIDGNFHVDFLDFAILADDWLECSDPCDLSCTGSGLLAGDIVPDYYVNIYDLAFFAERWLDCLVEQAKSPHPVFNSVYVDPNAVLLKWTTGAGAIEHDVYLGTDANAVANADYFAEEYMGTFSDANFDPCSLDANTTYFWRIDETGLKCATKGEVWTFRTKDNDGQLYVPSEYPTIQEAIDSTINGDVVIVAPGTYTGPGNRDIDFKGKVITVRSENGPESCIIDCNGLATDPHRGFYFHSGEGSGSIVSGLTITNGYASSGGGILCGSPTKPTIRNCIIKSNKAEHGGGISCIRSGPKIINCAITKNRASIYGGGFDLWDSAIPTITGCTIAHNSAIYGGGAIYSGYSSDPKISNSIIWDNNSTRGEDEIDTTSFEGDATISYSDVRGGWPGIGNIDTDPCFVGGPVGDYYLSQIAAGQTIDSPCVNAGSGTATKLGMDIFTTRTDQVGDAGIVDMGYHFSGNHPDLNNDGIVNLPDFAILALQWLDAPGVPSADIAPFGGDNIVDGLDLCVLADSWLKGD
jgi:hypothetical protein